MHTVICPVCTVFREQCLCTVSVNCVFLYSVCLPCSLYSACVQCSVHSILCTVFCVQCSVYSVLCIVFSKQFSVYSVLCTAFCLVFSVQCLVFCLQCSVCKVLYPEYSYSDGHSSPWGELVWVTVHSILYYVYTVPVGSKCHFSLTNKYPNIFMASKLYKYLMNEDISE